MSGYTKKRGRWPAIAWFVAASALGIPLGVVLSSVTNGGALIAVCVAAVAVCSSSLYSLARYNSRRLHQLYAHARQLAGEDRAVAPELPADELAEAKRLMDAIGEASRDAQYQLHRTNRLSTLGSLAAAMTHEVRNPLTGLLGFIQLAMSKHTRPERVPELVSSAEDEAKRCRDTIERFLAYCRREQREVERLELNETVEQARELFAHHLKMRQIRLVTDLADDVPAIDGVSAELHQVLLNLVLNAGDATAEGGAVMVTTRRLPNGRAQIEVSDTGTGIPEEMRDRIFEPFFTTKGGAGTGLGLSVSREIIEAHGGTIELADDSSSSGATFLIELPAAEAASSVDVVDELAAKRSSSG